MNARGSAVLAAAALALPAPGAALAQDRHSHDHAEPDAPAFGEQVRVGLLLADQGEPSEYNEDTYYITQTHHLPHHLRRTLASLRPGTVTIARRGTVSWRLTGGTRATSASGPSADNGGSRASGLASAARRRAGSCAAGSTATSARCKSAWSARSACGERP